MNKPILVALLALSVVLLAKADGDWDDYDGDDDCGYDDRIDNDLDDAEVSLRSKRAIPATYKDREDGVIPQRHHEIAGAREESNKARFFLRR